ncbi:MAG TPA: glycosyltransferase [Rhodocyclaceae bacterium]|nr:glycosyltransferase [Rhodocyclaceae bacterium]
MSNVPFHIAFCVDDNYCRPMGATIASIIDNNPGQAFVFHVLMAAASEDNRRDLSKLEARFPDVQVQLHMIDTRDFSQFGRFIEHTHYSLSIFTRLVIPSVLTGVTERVLYLDADILCVGKLDELVNMDLGGDIAAAVADAPVTTQRRVASLKLEQAEYFNGGVIFINIPQWQAHRITEATMDVLLNRDGDLRFPDQDALNVVLNGRTRFLPGKFNYLYDLIHDLNVNKTAMRPVGDAALIHFAGAVKPWTEWSGHDARELFRKYHAMSPWSHLPLDQAPRNTKELRMHSRFLFRQGKPLQSLRWYLKYLRARKKRK